MDGPIQKAVLGSVAKALRPIVRLCLRHGLNEAAFAHLLRQLYVAEASRQLRQDSQRPSVSAIASLTGLSRKEVARLKSADTDQLLNESRRRDRVTRVLSGWINDEEFSGEGAKRVLPMHGEGVSFFELVRRYGGDVTPTAMLNLLTAAGNVERGKDGSVVLVSEAYIPTQTPLEKLEIFGTDGAELLDTIEHNIRPETRMRRFQRKVSNSNVSSKALDRFRHITETESMALLERFDAWLADNEANAPEESSAYVAVGIYFYEKQSEDVDDLSKP